MAENQKKKFKNTITVKGLLAEKSLEIKTTKTGKEHIVGKLVVKTGENSLHEFKVDTYKLKKDGNINPMFTGLVTVMETHNSIATHGEEADAVELKAQLNMEDYKSRDGRMVNFVSKVVSSCSRINKAELEVVAQGNAHMILNKASMEINKEGEETGRAKVVGYIKHFSGSIFPVEFVIENPKGVDRILASDMETGLTLEIRYELMNKTETRIEVIEYDFGDPEEKEFTSYVNEYVITGLLIAEQALQMSAEDFKKGLTERQLKLDEIANEVKSTPATAPSKPAPVTTDFDF